MPEQAWIPRTERAPTREDGDEQRGCLWVQLPSGGRVIAHWQGIWADQCVAFMPIRTPDPYVPPEPPKMRSSADSTTLSDADKAWFRKIALAKLTPNERRMLGLEDRQAEEPPVPPVQLKPGKWRRRDGRPAWAVHREAGNTTYPWTVMYDTEHAACHTDDGNYAVNREDDRDLIEPWGDEPPVKVVTRVHALGRMTDDDAVKAVEKINARIDGAGRVEMKGGE